MTGQISETAATLGAERPSLARNVRLIGELPGNGFTQRQWLIERDSQFIQVSELLYKLAEQLNGERTLPEVAAVLTESTEWAVEAEDVDQLIREKLAPLSLIARGDSAAPVVTRADRSPLAVSMRMRVVGPRALRPITFLLQYLYWPPILLAFVFGGVAAHWWLYRTHGVAESIRDTLYTPGGFPLVIGIVLLSAFFHEFGHASALRYGGGEARAMGCGFYLLYPAFYTDVTDSYRLGRWARIRVDLGGIYFHLVFCLGLMGLALATGKELFLFAVLLINLDMVRQFIPFVRLDGYWFLADLTGIPDFFSMMKPFLLSLIPGRRSNGMKLPQLRPWVKVVFLIYIVATVPVLGYLLFLLVKTFPIVVAESWRGLHIQTELLRAPGREPWTIALIVLSMVFLVVPVLGSVLILALTAVSGAALLRQWSGGAASRQAVGAAVAVAVLAGTAWLWHGQLPRIQSTLNPRAAGASQSDQLMTATLAATQGAVTLQADIQGAIGPTPFSGRVVLKKPNLAHVEIAGGPEFGEFRVVSDGRNAYTYFPHDRSVLEIKAAPDGRNIRAYVTDHVESFFHADLLKLRGASAEKQAQEEIVDGVKYDVVELRTTGNAGAMYYRIYISPADRLPHRIVKINERKGGYAVSWSQLTNVRINEPVDDQVFAWSAPSGTKPLELPAGVSLPLSSLANQ
jgi:outer membrane lipoprotein-sorting protein